MAVRNERMDLVVRLYSIMGDLLKRNEMDKALDVKNAAKIIEEEDKRSADSAPVMQFDSLYARLYVARVKAGMSDVEAIQSIERDMRIEPGKAVVKQVKRAKRLAGLRS